SSSFFILRAQNYKGHKVHDYCRKSTPYLSLFSSGKEGRAKFLYAGPSITSPSTVNRLPWHGQSQLFSVLLKCTIQPKCVQTDDTICSSLLTSRKAAIFSPFNSKVLPSLGLICLSSSTSPYKI